MYDLNDLRLFAIVAQAGGSLFQGHDAVDGHAAGVGGNQVAHLGQLAVLRVDQDPIEVP